MQYQVILTIKDAEDIFDIVKQLEPIKDIPGVKMAMATPRPEAAPQQAGGTPAAVRAATPLAKPPKKE